MSIFTAVLSDITQDLLKYRLVLEYGQGYLLGRSNMMGISDVKRHGNWPIKVMGIVYSEFWVMVKVESGLYAANTLSVFRSRFWIRSQCLYTHECISAHPRRHVLNASERPPRPSGYGFPKNLKQEGLQAPTTTIQTQQVAGYRNLGRRSFIN